MMIRPTDPNQIQWHQKTTRRHTDKTKFSDVMNIFCFCSTSAISVPPFVLKWCRKEHKKMQVKKESQQNRSRWWIWYCDTAQRIRTCLPRWHRRAREKPNLKVKNFWARGMCCNQIRGDLYWALAHQTTQNGTLTTSGLLKCGNLMKCWEQERWDPWMTSLSSMMIWTLTPSQNRIFL